MTDRPDGAAAPGGPGRASGEAEARQQLVAAISRAAAKLQPAAVAALADQLTTISPTGGPPGQAVVAGLGPNPALRQHVDAIIRAWVGCPAVTGPAVALALRAAAHATGTQADLQRIELVATGPATWRVPVRRTADVLIQLINSAQQSLLLVSFAAYKVPEVVAAIRAAADRGVHVRLLLEDSETGNLTHDAAAAFADLEGRVTHLHWPAAERAIVNGRPAAMHAKAAIADDRVVFITSANLTGNALDHNMELGTLITGGPLPGQLLAHFAELQARGILTSS